MKLNIMVLCLIIFNSISYCQSVCKCENRDEKKEYINAIKTKLVDSCTSCTIDEKETLLIYDAKCKKFLFEKGGVLRVLEDLNELKLYYKKPFRIKVVNFNRYLYNLNLGNSDIAFTSAEPQILQQYFLPGTSNGLISPANTFINSGSQNEGNYVFSSIADFKSNMDKLLSEIGDLTLPITNNLNRLISPIHNTISQNNRVFQEMFPATLFQQITNLDNIGNSFNSNSSKIDSFNIFQSYVGTARSLAKKVENNKPQKKDPILFAAFDSLISQLNRVAESHLNLTRLQDIKDSSKQDYIQKVEIFKTRILSFGNYCDSFIDNRITAYSLCTTKLNCCGNDSILTFKYFNTLVNDISKQIPVVKKAKRQFDLDSNNYLLEKKKVEDSGTKVVRTKVNEKGKPFVLKVSAADIIFDKAKMTGITLHQIQDVPSSKEEPATDPLKQISDLWFSFEKSLPTDYIMRQLLFRRNMLNENLSYTTPPIFPYGDHLGINMQISVSDSVRKMGTMPTYTEKIALDFQVLGRPMFSFSAGSFVGAFLNTNTYDWQQIPALGSNTIQDNSPYQLKRSGTTGTPIGISGLANITWPWPRWFFNKQENRNLRLGVSGGIGAIVDPTPVRLGYFLGITGSIGTYQQFHFTLAPIGMKVNVLKNDLNTDYYYATKPTIDLYTQKMKLGLCFSITYTVFTPKNSGETNGIINTSTNSTK